MNLFIEPEFWLSFSFLTILGIIVLPPVRRFVQIFFQGQRQKILDKITQANEALFEAQKLLEEEQKDKIKTHTKEQKQQINTIQQEFLTKTNKQIQAKKQDYQVRLNLAEIQIKNQLRSELLNQVEAKILKSSSKKSLDKEIQHLLLMLNEEHLKKIFY